jgi:hypothetical protein
MQAKLKNRFSTREQDSIHYFAVDYIVLLRPGKKLGITQLSTIGAKNTYLCVQGDRVSYGEDRYASMETLRS